MSQEDPVVHVTLREEKRLFPRIGVSINGFEDQSLRLSYEPLNSSVLLREIRDCALVLEAEFAFHLVYGFIQEGQIVVRLEDLG
jgi:hypothetical protein